MKKSSMLRISEGYCYGLKDDKDLVVRSTAGNYTRHFDIKEDQESDSQGEYVEEIDEKPTDLKPPVQETEVNGSSEGCRNELFEEIQELNNLANLSVNEKSIDQTVPAPRRRKNAGTAVFRSKT